METEGLERRVRVCLSQAVAAASPVLLEPVMRVEVQSRGQPVSFGGLGWA